MTRRSVGRNKNVRPRSTDQGTASFSRHPVHSSFPRDPPSQVLLVGPSAVCWKLACFCPWNENLRRPWITKPLRFRCNFTGGLSRGCNCGRKLERVNRLISPDVKHARFEGSFSVLGIRDVTDLHRIISLFFFKYYAYFLSLRRGSYLMDSICGFN